MWASNCQIRSCHLDYADDLVRSFKSVKRVPDRLAKNVASFDMRFASQTKCTVPLEDWTTVVSSLIF